MTARNRIFSLKSYFTLPEKHKKHIQISLVHSWTTIHSQNNRPYAPNKT